MAETKQTKGSTTGRRVFFLIYVVFIASFGLWNLLSVLAVHAGFHEPKLHFKGPRISPAANKPAELLGCHREMDQLLNALHRETFSIQARALKFNFDPAAEWRNWSPGWLRRLRLLDRRCRLSELAGTGAHKAIDSLAEIHTSLLELQISYTGVMDRFVEGYSRRLRTLKAKLGAVRGMIQRPRSGSTEDSPSPTLAITQIGSQL